MTNQRRILWSAAAVALLFPVGLSIVNRASLRNFEKVPDGNFTYVLEPADSSVTIRGSAQFHADGVDRQSAELLPDTPGAVQAWQWVRKQETYSVSVAGRFLGTAEVETPDANGEYAFLIKDKAGAALWSGHFQARGAN